MRRLAIRLVLLALFLACSAPVLGADTDADGLPDELERTLGSDPAAAAVFRTVLNDGIESEEARSRPGYDATKDVVDVQVCHAGGDRFLWRVKLADAPRLDDTVLHLYVDADSNPDTGRKVRPGAPNHGVEYMLSVVGGVGRSTVFKPDGEHAASVLVSHGMVDNQIVLSADVDLGRHGEAARFELYVLCHTTTGGGGPRMTDSTRRVVVSSIPLLPRAKIRRLVDINAPENTSRTYGLDALRATLGRSDVVVVPPERLELDGFEVDMMTHRRYAHVTRTRPLGTVAAIAPKGRFHVGFAMYDDSRDERVVFRVDGTVRGAAFANVNNNRHWIYWLDEATEFSGGEKVELLGVGPSGEHGICNVLFLPEPLSVKSLPYAIEHVTAWTAVGEDGTATVSWTTRMPTPTRFRYGGTSAYGLDAGSDRPALVHRVVLTGLDPNTRYHGQAVGVRPGGTTYTSPDVTFGAKGAVPPPTRAGTATVPLRVRNPHAVHVRDVAVTSGIPFPQGALSSAENVRLLHAGTEVPLQVRETARWLDGSVKWLLLSFPAAASPAASVIYDLEWGREVVRPATGPRIATRNAGDVVLQTGTAEFRVSRNGLLVLPNGKPCVTTITTADGSVFRTGTTPAQVEVEENGVVRAVVHTVSQVAGAEGKPLFRIEKRIEACRGSAMVRVSHTLLVQGTSEFTEFESVVWNVPVAPDSWRTALASGDTVQLTQRAPLRQLFDDEITILTGARPSRRTGRVAGVFAGDSALVAVRDFWQQYPKGVVAADDGLSVELLPDFPDGLYDGFPFEKEGHHLYYYLRNGRYRLKRGMAKTHELLVSLAPLPATRTAHGAIGRRRLLATAPPEWVCSSRVFYDVAPQDPKRFKAYEEAMTTNLRRYVERRGSRRDYGMMNFGDWYGERGSNWGNVEYDTQHAFLLEYIRSGNEDAFVLGDRTEVHNRDIDTVQWHPDDSRIGGVYVHQMCHVGGYYDRSVPGTLGFPKAGFTVSHAWAEGHFNHYFLTGDRRSLDTGRAVVDYFIRKDLGRPYDFTSCRVPGWHLMMNAIAYASTCDPYYLNASRVIVDRVLETQDLVPRPLPGHQRKPGRTHQFGGWSRMMHPGHCHCEPRHQGNAGFMVAVLLSGLKYYHDVTKDEAVKEAIIAGARYLVAECYSHEVHGFRYTSCPETSYRPGSSPLMAEGIARAYRWTRDADLRDVLTEALPMGADGSSYGKGFSMYYRVAPRVLADLAACGLGLEAVKRPPPVPFRPPVWMRAEAGKQVIVVQAEDFAAQGEGQCQIREDRQGMMGKIVTYWHQDIGHWLEWTFDVPQTDDYALRFHYATGSEGTRRELRVDGAVPCPAAKDIPFPKTGGYGAQAKHWRFRQITDRNGREAFLRLTRGKHTIRMINLNDGLALDFIALVASDAGAIREKESR